MNTATIYGCEFTNPHPKSADPNTWIAYTYRIADGRAIRGYNLRHAWYFSNYPKYWLLESSADGVTWETMDSQSNYALTASGQSWYNNGGVYPESYDVDAAPDKVIVAIVECADCLDASTDSVGRSYKTGKTLEDFIGEVQEGAGTRYAPYMAELLLLPEVQSDLRKILKGGRDDNYRKAYRILEGLYEV